MFKANELNEKLKKNDITIGSWLQIPSTITTEILAKAGFEWLSVDLEHTIIGLNDMQHMFQAMQAYNVTPLVRLSSHDPVQIKKVLDAGAFGIIVPDIRNKEQAEDIIRFSQYPPAGKRGVGLSRAQGYGIHFQEYKRWIQDNLTIILQIEHIDAINNLESILNIPAIQGSIIGPYDLSASLGFPGEFERKEVKEAINTYLKVCKKVKKPAGFHVVPPYMEELKIKINEGFTFLGFSMDSLLLAGKIKDELKELTV